MRRADAAIVGELVAVIPRNRLRADYRYRVQHVYKGGQGIWPGRLISVRSARESAACGLPDRIGRRYGLLLDSPTLVHRMDAKAGADEPRPWLGGLCGVVAPQKLRTAAGHASAVDRRAPGSTSCTS